MWDAYISFSEIGKRLSDFIYLSDALDEKSISQLKSRRHLRHITCRDSEVKWTALPSVTFHDDHSKREKRKRRSLNYGQPLQKQLKSKIKIEMTKIQHTNVTVKN